MDRRKFLQVLVTVAALIALGAWSYSSAPESSPRTDGIGRIPATGTSIKQNAHPSTTVRHAPSSTLPPAPTTTVATNPTSYANALYRYWMNHDRTNAAQVATADVVRMLFARPYKVADAWTNNGCTGSAGPTSCTWASPRRRFVFQVRNPTATAPLLIVAMQILH